MLTTEWAFRCYRPFFCFLLEIFFFFGEDGSICLHLPGDCGVLPQAIFYQLLLDLKNSEMFLFQNSIVVSSWTSSVCLFVFEFSTSADFYLEICQVTINNDQSPGFFEFVYVYTSKHLLISLTINTLCKLAKNLLNCTLKPLDCKIK